MGDSEGARVYYQHIYSNELTQEPPIEGIRRQVFADGSGRSAAQFLAKYERARRHDAERDKGVRKWDVEKQARSQNGDGSGAESATTKYGAYFCATRSRA